MPSITVTDPVLRAIVEGWQHWHGNLSDFAKHLHTDLGLDVSRTSVSNLLHAFGLRERVQRGRPDLPWSRDSFLRFFPGAQLLGDGTDISIEVGGERFIVNLELAVDVASSAIAGLSVSDTEDQAAVLDTIRSSLLTTGAPPLAMTLDNRPSNHTPAVEAAIAPTLLIRATPGRGQAKAAVEGAFGLFAQTAPPLTVTTSSPRELARDIVRLVTTVWARAVNGRPRKRLQGLSPADYYRQRSATEAERGEARRHFLELRRQARLAANTRGRRGDPVRLGFVAENLARLGIADPDGKVANDLARYANEALIRGFSIYGAKQQNGTLPPNAIGHRYLGGIIRNHDARLQLAAEARLQLQLRRRLGQLSWDALETTALSLSRSTTPSELPLALVDLALAAEPALDFGFFCSAAAQALQTLPPHQATELLDALIPRVVTAYRVPKARRSDLLAALTAAVTAQGAAA